MWRTFYFLLWFIKCWLNLEPEICWAEQWNTGRYVTVLSLDISQDLTEERGRIYMHVWFKHILLVNTKGLGVAKLRCMPSPKLYSCFVITTVYIPEKKCPNGMLIEEDGDPWDCGRGGEECPDGWNCVVDAADRWAVCCEGERQQYHSRSYYRGRRGHCLVWFSQNHGYFSPKRSQPGWFWSVSIISPRLILMSGYGHKYNAGIFVYISDRVSSL